MPLPNFYIIGAQKSATTALYHCLRQHPQIFMAKPKEPSYFALCDEKLDHVEPDGRPAMIDKSRYVTMEAYRGLFDSVSNERAIGEASVLYFSHPHAAEHIRELTPEAKFFALLRNPVDSAFSEFNMNRGFGIEPCDHLLDAVRDQERRKVEHCLSGLYIDTYLHYRNLKRYLNIFPRKKFRIFLHEDFRDNRQYVLRRVFTHLCVDENFDPEIPATTNVSGVPRSMALHRFLSIRMNPLARRIVYRLPNRARFFFVKLKGRNLQRQRLSKGVRKALIEYFREDILKLQDLLERDLSAWLR